MEIKNLKISNYKSIEQIELNNLNPFSVFVGPNASGKSNIFESLEFSNTSIKSSNSLDSIRLFGNSEDLLNRKNKNNFINISFDLNNNISPSINYNLSTSKSEIGVNKITKDIDSHLFHFKDDNSLAPELRLLNSHNETQIEILTQFYNFTRLFIGNSKIKRNNYIDDLKLNADASNLELVLKRILRSESIREELLEELQLLIPGFDTIEIRSDEISGTDTLLVYEKGTTKPFGKNLLSDGTYNIISLLVAIYQSQTPQFLCIEEPENGLNPFVAKEFVRIFRNACNEKGHFIWINTHSQSILSELKKEEVIIVDKINGGTIAKQIIDIDLQGLKVDEALFTNVIGGGTPW